MDQYSVVTTIETQGFDREGNLITIPAGTIVNTVLWDGESEWSPPEGTIAVKVEQHDG
jgi:hypothetical protein